MSEYKLQPLVLNLIQLMRSSSVPDEYIEKLQKQGISTNPIGINTVATQSCIQHLSKTAPNPEAFLKKYEELKSKKIDLLGPFMELLEIISIDKELKNYLAQVSTLIPESAPPKCSEVYLEDVPKIYKKIVSNMAEGERKLNIQTSATIKQNDFPIRRNTWYMERPRMSWDFQDDSTTQLYQRVVPSISQESIILKDILLCLKGIDGTYIISEPVKYPYVIRNFKIAADVDISYKQLAQRILPLASYYSTVVRFTEEKVTPQDGQVNHALRGAISLLLRDYMLFTVQLEKEQTCDKLTLQKLWCFIQPCMATMSVLYNITSTIFKADARGGKVLTLLHEKVHDMAGETKCKELCLFLLKAASVPYMEILEKWLYKGVICDPYNEFFVEDNELIQREELPMDYSADYWEKRYTMSTGRIPIFLNEHAHTILRTGKYFNVIRQCGKTVQWGKQEPLVYEYRDQKFIIAIDRAYSEAARTLLEVLLHENDLMGRLRSVKSYFLLAQGDFVVQFMNLCEAELNKNMYDIVIHRLASLLEVAVRTSTADSDAYKDDLKPDLLADNLEYQLLKILSIENPDKISKIDIDKKEKILTGIEAFVFNYDVKWPVSLIINRDAIAQYQILFRHIFYCKHVERLLCRVWLSNKIAKTFSHEAAMAYRQAFALRQRMLDCIQHLEYYMMVEVIEPNWLTFLDKMNKVNNVDEVLNVHKELLNTYMIECMLQDSDLLACITGICSICIEFCTFMQIECSPNATGDASSFEEKIIELDKQFTAILSQLLSKICQLSRENNNEKLLNVVCRLDFNLFYTQILAKSEYQKDGAK